MFKRATGAVLAGMLVFHPAGATDMTVAIGLGTSSCRTWVAVRGERVYGKAWGYEQWLLGFLSSGADTMNGSDGADHLRGLAPERVWAWMDNYCQVHPLDMLAVAAKELLHADLDDAAKPKPQVATRTRR